MATKRRRVENLEDERIRQHAMLEDEARWIFVVDDDARAAERPIRQAIRLWSKCYEGWTLYGSILRELGQTAAAIRAFRRAVRLFPDIAEAYWEIGEIYEDRRRHARALAEYRLAKQHLRRGERDLRGYIAAGEVRCLLAMGRNEEALKTAREALRTVRGEPELKQLRDLALRRRHLTVVHPSQHGYRA